VIAVGAVLAAAIIVALTLGYALRQPGPDAHLDEDGQAPPW
jgi:hypothetical protein